MLCCILFLKVRFHFLLSSFSIRGSHSYQNRYIHTHVMLTITFLYSLKPLLIFHALDWHTHTIFAFNISYPSIISNEYLGGWGTSKCRENRESSYTSHIPFRLRNWKVSTLSPSSIIYRHGLPRCQTPDRERLSGRAEEVWWESAGRLWMWHFGSGKKPLLVHLMATATLLCVRYFSRFDWRH